MKIGYLYIITNEAWNGWVKIGRTTNIKSRLHTYQTGSPFKDYKVLYLIQHPEYKTAEKEVKALFKPFAKERKGEWFRVDLEIAKSQLDILLDKYIT